MQLKAAVIHTGYVEDAAVQGVAVYNDKGFDSVEELLGAFGKSVIDAYWSSTQHHRKLDECCVAAKEENFEHKRCHECGKFLQRDSSPTEDQGIRYCDEFLRGTCDSIGYVWDDIEKDGWEFWSFRPVFLENIYVDVHSYGAELMWHCAYGQVGSNPNIDVPYAAVLDHHVAIISRKNFKRMPTIYKRQ